MTDNRKIVHLDMDAFFASIEQRDHPELKGKPVIIAGDPDKRGVVSTCSYEARKFGIHSALASSTAIRLCPQGIFIKPKIQYYRQVSEEIFSIFNKYTDLVEPLSLDEAFLDVTSNKKGINDSKELAVCIKNEIKTNLGLTASAGVSFNKFLAKLASDYQKPDGLTEFTEDNYVEILDEMDIKKFFGIGKVSLETFHRQGIFKGKDLRTLSEEYLREIMYKRGSDLYYNIRGIDPRNVEPNRQRKSIGKETTFATDINLVDIDLHFQDIGKRLAEELEKKNIKGRILIIKIKDTDFNLITRRKKYSNSIQTYDEIMSGVRELVRKSNIEIPMMRLLGIYLTDLVVGQETDRQMTIWDL